MSKLDNRHRFCLYLPTVRPNQLAIGAQILLDDELIVHRLNRVLRLKPGDSIDFFTASHHGTLLLQESKDWKRMVSAQVAVCKSISSNQTRLTMGIGVLKKDALEEAVYSMAGMGASAIIPIVTSKSSEPPSPREITRLETAIIAACEQAKNVRLPILLPAQPLETYLSSPATLRCFFTATGASMPNLITALQATPATIQVLIGAEGGFTQAEEAAIAHAGWQEYALTPTILRAVDAARVVTGLIRSLVH